MGFISGNNPRVIENLSALAQIKAIAAKGRAAYPERVVVDSAKENISFQVRTRTGDYVRFNSPLVRKTPEQNNQFTVLTQTPVRELMSSISKGKTTPEVKIGEGFYPKETEGWAPGLISALKSLRAKAIQEKLHNKEITLKDFT